MPSVRVTDETYELLVDQANREDRPIVRVLRSAIEGYCNTQNDPPPGVSPKRGGSPNQRRTKVHGRDQD